MRLLTRSDFDGLACAALLTEKGVVDNYDFVHPQDLQDGKVEVSGNDVLANVPYVPGCGLWFDHHFSEDERLDIESLEFEGTVSHAASAAQVIWDHYGGRQVFDIELMPLLQAVNIADAGSFTDEEVMNPEGWVLLSFIMDPRTGLGYYKDFQISNYRLMMDMIHYCRTMPAEEIIETGDVKQRIDRYFDHQDPFEDMLKRTSRIEDNLIITNLLNEETIYAGNRFIAYALHPEQNIDLRIMWGKEKQNVVIACGHSIFNRSSRTNVGKLMLEYGGGGHSMAGTCQIPIDTWEETLDEIATVIRKQG
ncbi:MAG: exopolyphosphatase [Proteobacteria bacterium]|nr:exopolyphosphatase [Pseudomonadota bacterium]